MCLFCTRLKNKLCNYLVEEMISIFRLPSLPEITPDKARSESHLYFSLFYKQVLVYTPGFTKKSQLHAFRQ